MGYTHSSIPVKGAIIIMQSTFGYEVDANGHVAWASAVTQLDGGKWRIVATGSNQDCWDYGGCYSDAGCNYVNDWVIEDYMDPNKIAFWVPPGVATRAPTAAPTRAPTAAPTKAPTAAPTRAPTRAPTKAPTAPPTRPPVVTQPPAGGGVLCTTTAAPMRADASATSAILQTIKRGKRVRDLGKTKSTGQVSWRKVEDSSGSKGWILSTQLGPCSLTRAEGDVSGSSSSWVVPVVVVCVVVVVAAVAVAVVVLMRRKQVAKTGSDAKYQHMNT